MAITFMAKFDEREGNSCHIHLSLRGEDGTPVFADDDTLFAPFLAGQLACLHELCLLYAPNVNSYKRFAAGSFAPTAIAWGDDNRTCALRVVGHGPSRRIELRLAGRRRQPLPRDRRDDRRGAARGRPGARARARLRGQRLRVRQAARPRHAARRPRRVRRPARSRTTAFGAEVVEHYLNNARIELEAFQAAVTDWERVRGFERL